VGNYGGHEVRALYPVWLVESNAAGPPGERLNTHSDVEDREVGLMYIHVPGIEGMHISVIDSDERFHDGFTGPQADLIPCERDTDHGKTCQQIACPHINEVSAAYVRSDMGWWLVIKLPDDRKVWIHENDVPIDNHPSRADFQRRPAKKLVDMSAVSA
jgi:hypothetical protein